MTLYKDQVVALLEELKQGGYHPSISVWAGESLRFVGVPEVHPNIPSLLGLRTDTSITYINFQKITAIYVARERSE